MIENKCVNTLEPEATLAEMNKQGYRLVSAISQFAGMLLFFERAALVIDKDAFTADEMQSIEAQLKKGSVVTLPAKPTKKK